MSSKPTRQIRSTSAFSMKGLVTSRRAVAAASWVASLATRVLRWTWTARYNTDKTTAIEPTNCETALIASQFITLVIPQVNTLSLFQLVSDFRTILARMGPLHHSTLRITIALLLAWLVAGGANQ